MNHVTLTDEQLETLEKVLDDWTKREQQEVEPRYRLLENLEELRFRCIDIPIRYRSDQPWQEDAETTETVVYAMSEELDRDVVPREIGHGFPDVVEVSTDFDEEMDAITDLQSDVAMVLQVAHNLGWTVQAYDEERIILRPAYSPEDVDSL